MLHGPEDCAGVSLNMYLCVHMICRDLVLSVYGFFSLRYPICYARETVLSDAVHMSVSNTYHCDANMHWVNLRFVLGLRLHQYSTPIMWRFVPVSCSTSLFLVTA